MNLKLGIERSFPHDWGKLVRPGQGMVAAEFLQACESTLANLTWLIPTVLNEDQLVGVAPGFLHTVGQLPGLRTRVLEFGQPCCPGPPLLACEPRATDLILKAACAELESGSVDLIAFRDLAEENTELERRLRDQSFVLLSVRDTFIVDASFSSFEAYLSAMRSRYRKRAMAYLRRPLQVELVQDFAHLADQIGHLVALTTSRSKESRIEKVDATVVRKWSACAKTAAMIIKDRSAVLAVGLILKDPPVLHFLRCGSDEKVARRLGGYVRLLYELVRYAIDHGYQYVDLGKTTAEPKLAVGAIPVPLRVLARHRNTLVQHALGLYGRIVESRPPCRPHRVFRAPRPTIDPFWYRLR